MDSQNTFSIISATLGVVAIIVALWQGVLSRRQLSLAQTTQTSTETALNNIERLTEENRRISEHLKAEFDQRIGRIVDQTIAAADRRAETEARTDRQGEEIAGQFLGWLGDAIGEPLKQAIAEGSTDAGYRRISVSG